MLKGNSNKKDSFRGLYQTTEAVFDDFRLEYLGEFEAIFETALEYCLMKKTEGRKSRDSVPLRGSGDSVV
jgi:hypothetical protein